MYLSYYNLKHKPFQISTDPGFLWLGEKHMEALATLRYGVMDNKGFLLLTGDVGTGKTTLINTLLKSLGESVLVACLRDPGLTPLEFFNYVAAAFGMNQEITSKGTFLVVFEKFLNDLHQQQKKALLIIDEAQRIDQELLEEVRLLSNIEKVDSKLLNIFFVGQIEFNDILLRPINRPIRQRITVNYNIETLSQRETEKYINHRLQIAMRGDLPDMPAEEPQNGDDMFVQERFPAPPKNSEVEIFSDEAIREIHLFASGYPRLINIICDRALLTGYVEDSQIITAKQIRECAKELEIPYFGLKDEDEPPRRTAPQKRPPDIAPAYEVPIHMPADEEPTKPSQSLDTPAIHGNSPKKRLSIAAAIFFALIAAAFYLTQYPGASTEMFESIQDSGFGQSLSAGWQNIEKLWTDPQTPRLEAMTDPSPAGTMPPPAAKAETGAASADTENIGDKVVLTQNKKRTGLNGQSQQVVLERLIMPFPEGASLPPLPSLANLNMVVDSVVNEENAVIVVKGFTNTDKEETVNRRLSEEKANAVRIYLISKGIDESRIETQGLGAQSPLASGNSPSARAANQRVEIEIRR